MHTDKKHTALTMLGKNTMSSLVFLVALLLSCSSMSSGARRVEEVLPKEYPPHLTVSDLPKSELPSHPAMPELPKPELLHPAVPKVPKEPKVPHAVVPKPKGV